MKFEIKSRWTGAVIFTADIDCDDGASHSINLGFAVKVAVNANADLAGANLAHAYLARADLAGADLAGADLAGANLAGADLAGADLAGADLAGADLAHAYLAHAYLARADLAGANLAHAYLAGADLAGANLAGADLAHADLAGAYLNGITGLNDWIKCIQIEDWPISYTSEIMQIGCQRHPLDAWRNFSDAEIRAMDGRKALAFWTKWKEWIFQTIEMAPAKPTAPVYSEVAQ